MDNLTIGLIVFDVIAGIFMVAATAIFIAHTLKKRRGAEAESAFLPALKPAQNNGGELIAAITAAITLVLEAESAAKTKGGEAGSAAEAKDYTAPAFVVRRISKL